MITWPVSFVDPLLHNLLKAKAQRNDIYVTTLYQRSVAIGMRLASVIPKVGNISIREMMASEQQKGNKELKKITWTRYSHATAENP